MHDVDARIKQLWLLVLLVGIGRVPIPVRAAAAALVALLSVLCLPRSLWRPQLTQLGLFALLVFTTTLLFADGVPPVLQSHTAPNALMDLPSVGAEGGYRYVLAQLGPLTITKKSLNLAVTSGKSPAQGDERGGPSFIVHHPSPAASFLFTALQSASLCLVTTPAESMAQGIAWFLRPLALLRLPLAEIHMTLLLSLRFMGIVFEEFRNLTLGLASRGIDWKRMGFAGGADVAVTLCGRLFNNLFAHAENISQAMVMRGFVSSDQHNLYLQQLRPTSPLWNTVALLGVAGLVAFIARAA